MPNWIRATGRVIARSALAINPQAYAMVCGNPATADAKYCGTPVAPRKSRRERRAERDAAETAREQREYACGDWTLGGANDAH